mmetsp:Transcript_34701/g.82966  ORF Transcript_34701/g.82966 Transcript_34701/m.82966 type:complete len:384 (+) Transcript_34701:215-1366(+)
MSDNRNLVRDNTLVLRVLVPGLHTSLNDKINAKKESEPLASPPSSGVPSGGSSSGGSRLGADQILNLDGVTCIPSNKGSTLWHFRCDGATYPARLVNLPCPVEVHKTLDHANYHKASDVGQMLIVYEDEYSMEEAENDKEYKVEGFPSYFHSGLTPPMRRVVQRRFLSRFEERDTKPVPPPRSEVSQVETELQELIAKLSKGAKKPGKPAKIKRRQTTTKATTAAITAKEIIEEVEDEVVDYEPWMGEGGVFTESDPIATHHPEWWLTTSELKEIRDQKKKDDDEKRRQDEEKAEQERIQSEKAEQKRKRKEARKKKKEESSKEKKGIPSKRNRESLPVSSSGDMGGDMVDNIAAMLAVGEEADDNFDGLFDNLEGDDLFSGL